MKILIVAIFFPPQNSIASLRPYTWAKYWAQWGHDVTVLTTPKPLHPANLQTQEEQFCIIEVPVFNKFTDGESGRQSSKKLPDSADATQYPNGKLSGILRHLLNTVQARYGIFNFARLPDKHDLWVLRGLPKVSNTKWDAVVTTGGPYSVHFIGYALKRRGLADFWCLDWRDLWTDNHIYLGLPLVRIFERYLERMLHKKADVITTVSEPLAAILRSKAGDKVTSIYNGFDPDDYKTLPQERIFPMDGVFRIVYTGTIYPGKRDPTPLFRAIRLLHEQGELAPSQLQVIMAGHNANLTEMAHSEKVEEYLQYAGFVSREDALRMQRDTDALLFLEFEAPGVKGILTGKLFEYLVAGPPIIAVGINSQSETGLIIERNGRGNAFGVDVGPLAIAIQHYLKSGVNYQQKDRDSVTPDILRFSRAEQAARLISILSKSPKKD